MKTFVATFESYSSPLEVLEKLIQRYQVPQKFKQFQDTIQFRVCVVLQQLIKTHFNDFYDGFMKEKLDDFIQNVIKEEKMRSMLQSEIEKKVTKVKNYHH